MKTPTRAHLEAAARDFFDQLANEIDHPRRFPEDGFRQAVAYNIHLSEQRITELDRQLISNDFELEADGLATRMLSSLGLTLDQLEPETALLARQLAVRAAREQDRYLIHALTSPARRFTPADEVIADGALASHDRRSLRGLEAQSHPTARDDGTTLSEATADYLRQKARSGVGPSQVDETARLLDWLQQALGPSRPLSGITKKDLQRFRDDLMRIDVRKRGRPGQFQDRLTDDREAQVKSATYLRYWNTVCAFFTWCGSELITPPHAEYRPARFCFFASATVAIILAAVWGAQSSLGLIVRSVVVGGIGALSALLLMGGLQWVRKNDEAAAPPASKGSVAAQPSTKPAAPQSVTSAPAAQAEEHPRSHRAPAASLADIPSPDRTRYKKALQGFYLETDELLEKIIAMPRDDQMDEAQRLADGLSERTSAWIKANMGPVAVARPGAPSNCQGHCPTSLHHHSNQAIVISMEIIDLANSALSFRARHSSQRSASNTGFAPRRLPRS